ncbi:hypothetical protein LMG31886_01520 [Xanthomonas hydrangeae]|nr:hypothetical protein LMG31886_01520 [Xanthomonas hydrangeae]CAD7720535.1 hypothetical protein LMG31886_01520 [Xanthomonas hydrangeae]CAD7729756.1 hypothetical protein LMG31885_13960 [Xanthomonas hydrangeae]CAD7729761.1 hypothetical protein LMG31885_13960 [Xanthomonas hydrangeae]
MNWHRSNRYLTALTPAGNPTPELLLDYDALGRLTALKDGTTEAVIDGYSYDGTGNRLSAKIGGAPQAYTYPTTNHRLSAVAGVARTYDKMGNTLTIGGKAREYLYDTTGRMTQAKRAGVAVMNYRYNGRGEQVRRYLGTTNTYTLYDQAGHWLGDYDTNGAPKQQAIWLDDLPDCFAKRGSKWVRGAMIANNLRLAIILMISLSACAAPGQGMKAKKTTEVGNAIVRSIEAYRLERVAYPKSIDELGNCKEIMAYVDSENIKLFFVSNSSYHYGLIIKYFGPGSNLCVHRSADAENVWNCTGSY